VADRRPGWWWWRGGGGRCKYSRGELGVARAEPGVHLLAWAHAARDEDAPALALAHQQHLSSFGRPMHFHVARVGIGTRTPKRGDTVDAGVGDHGHGLDLRSGQWKSATSWSRVPIVGHFVGNGGGVGVVEHARVVPGARDADADRVWNGLQVYAQ